MGAEGSTGDDDQRGGLVARGRVRAVMVLVVAVLLLGPALLVAVEPTAPPAGWAELVGDQPFEAREILRWPYRVVMLTPSVWIPLDLVLGMAGALVVLAMGIAASWPRLALGSANMEALVVLLGLAVCAALVSGLLIVPGLKLAGAFVLLMVTSAGYGAVELARRLLGRLRG